MTPSPAPILDLIEAFRRSKTMFAAVKLGVFERMPATAEELASALGTDAAALERLLDGCAALGLLRKSGPVYTNDPVAERYLRLDSPDTLTGYVLYSNDALFRLWTNLEDAVREGTHRWTQTFGWDGPLFSHFFQTEEARRTFLSGMHGFGRISSPAVVRAFDLSRFHRLVDLGGGTGHLAACAQERFPGLSVAVFDLPGVTPHSRVEAIAGDFFADPLPPADLYALCRIVHDWSEPRVRLLLRKVFEALPERGGLLIAEALLDPGKTSPVHGLMQSLNMLVCTEGRERTFDEYHSLLREAGFSGVEAKRTGTPLDAILAIK